MDDSLSPMWVFPMDSATHFSKSPGTNNLDFALKMFDYFIELSFFALCEEESWVSLPHPILLRYEKETNFQSFRGRNCERGSLEAGGFFAHDFKEGNLSSR